VIETPLGVTKLAMSVLYTTEILRLATSIPHIGRLDHPAGTAECRSQTCGSRIIVDVMLDQQGRISDFAQTVSACALGQASAALMGGLAMGRSRAELIDVKNALAGFLSGARADPGPWPGLAIFQGAIAYSARHAAILLPFEAIAEAAERAQP
jgi:NifU-like protein involved in Fe-S cluster formation